MNETGNGNYRLREIERRLRHLEEHGSGQVAIALERLTALSQRLQDVDRELRGDIEDCRKENAGTKSMLGRIGLLALSIPATIIGGVLLFWIQGQ